MKKALATMMVVLAIGAVASAATLTIDIVPSATVLNPGEQFTIQVYGTVSGHTGTEGITGYSVNITTPDSAGVVNAKEQMAGPVHTGKVVTTFNQVPTFTSINPNWTDAGLDGDMDAMGLAGAWDPLSEPYDTGCTRTLLATETWIAGAPGVANLSVYVDPDSTVRDWLSEPYYEREFDSVVGIGSSVTVTPEPATLGLLALGVLGLLRRR